MSMHNPAHPGAVLKDALESIPMSVTDFAAHIGMSRTNMSRVLNGRAGVTPKLSIKLSQAFGQPSPDIWFKMQGAYDFWQAAHESKISVKPLSTAA